MPTLLFPPRAVVIVNPAFTVPQGQHPQRPILAPLVNMATSPVFRRQNAAGRVHLDTTVKKEKQRQNQQGKSAMLANMVTSAMLMLHVPRIAGEVITVLKEHHWRQCSQTTSAGMLECIALLVLSARGLWILDIIPHLQLLARKMFALVKRKQRQDSMPSPV
jgi:hypothetical protein